MAEQKSPSPVSPRTLPPVVQAQKNAGAAPGARTKPATKQPSNFSSLPFWTGLIVSIAWVGVVILIVAASGPTHSFGGVALVNWAIGVSAIVSPVALVWMVTAYMQRAADIQSIAEPLRRQLLMITGESGAAEARIRRFNQAIKEQLDLLRGAQSMSQQDLAAVMDRVRQHRNDLEKFEHASIHQVKEIQEIIRRNMQQVEHLMDDKFTMLRVLDDKLVQSGDSVARQTESVRDQVAKLLEEIGANGEQLSGALERAMQDSRKLADTSRAQETSLLTAAETASETLGAVSSKIDLSVARFLERAGIAREEAERLAGALDTQTRSLDEFSNTLPARVSEAESVLRGVADRLYASEQLAREQAVVLSEKLSQQVDGLEQFLIRFSSRLTEIDGGLDKRRNDLNGLANSIGETTSGFVQAWERSINELNDRTGNTLLRFTVVNDETRKNAEFVAAHLNETTTKYENVAGRVRNLSSESHEQLKSMTGEIVNYLSQFESLRDASHKAGSEVQERAAAAMQNLQYVLERLLAARESAQAVGGTLIKDLYSAAEQNEQIIGRLNEAAQMSVRALGGATDSLGKQEEDLTARARAIEALLDRVAIHYNDVAQATAQTHGKIETLNATLTQQLSLIGNGTTQLEAQASQLATSSGKTIQQLSALNEKFAVTHDVANSNAQQTLTRLDECNTAFMRQGNSLNEAAQVSVTLIQKAGMTFGEQAGKMLDTSHQMEQSLRQLTATTSALADQSSQIRNNMEQHNQRLIAQLTEAVTQMDTAGSKLEQSVAQAATGVDQTSARFLEMTQNASSRLKESQQEMQAVAGKAETTLAALGTNIAQQASSLSSVSEQLNEQYRTLSVANENQRTQLVDLFDKLGGAHTQASEVAERTIARLNDALAQIQRNLGALSDQSQTAVGNVRTASAGFADQSSLLLQNAQQAEQQARTVLSVTAALQDQARQLREALHGEGERTGEILGTLLSKISVSGVELREFGSSTEMVLTSLQNGIAQQGGALNSTMQQITDRQRSLTVALDAQRDVINGLLSRLALAQDETASNAERTVARLTDGAQQITKQLEVIGAQAQNTLASVHAAGAGFADEAGTLGVHAQQAEQQMRAVLSVTAGMQEQARQLRESMQGETARVIEQLNSVITQLDTTNSQLKLQSGTAIHAMDQSALQVAALTRSSGESLQKQAEILSQTAEMAEARMANAGDKIRGHLKLVSDVGEQTEQKANQLADAAEFAANRMATLRDTMADADKDGHNTLAQASARINEVKATLQNELQRLTEMSQQAVQQVTAASQSVATQSDVLRANLASSESALVQAATLIREETTQMPATIDRSTAKIEHAVAVMQAQSDATDKSLVQTADRFISVTTTARESMVGEMRRVSSVADEADKVLRMFNKSLAEQVASMQQSSALLSGEQKELVGNAGESIAQLAAASDRLAQLRVDATQTAEKLAQQFDTMDQRATATGQRLTQANDVVVKNMDALAQATQRAEGQMLGASSSFREQLERIRTGVQAQIDDINRGLVQITTQLERTGNTLRSTTVGTVADVERISQRFDETSKEAADQLVDKTARMRGATEEVAKLLSGFGDQLDVLLDRLSVAGDGIRRHEGDLVGQMQTALSHLSAVTEKLEAGRALTTNVSEQAVARLTNVTETIQKQMQGLTSDSQTAAGVLRGVSQIYGDQTQALNKNVGDAHSQVQTMNKAIDEMQQRTDRMRVSLKMQGEDLMGSLQKILSQLSSTGDALSQTVDQVLQEQAEKNLKKMG